MATKHTKFNISDSIQFSIGPDGKYQQGRSVPSLNTTPEHIQARTKLEDSVFGGPENYMHTGLYNLLEHTLPGKKKDRKELYKSWVMVTVYNAIWNYVTALDEIKKRKEDGMRAILSSV